MDSNYLQKDDEEPGDAAREDEGDGGELNDVADDLGDAATAEKAAVAPDDNSEEAPNKSAQVGESDNVPVSGSTADAKEE